MRLRGQGIDHEGALLFNGHWAAIDAGKLFRTSFGSKSDEIRRTDLLT
jgi:hypothetical protein